LTHEPAFDDELWVIVGPTASGKTELAIALSELHGGEIVSADSVQIYRHFQVGTGKPNAAERARARHHLIDIVEPDEPMDAARFAELAAEAIAQIRARGKRPIVCGGSFLWVKSLIFGLVPAPPADPVVRAEHKAHVDREGRAGLHARLAAVDRESASRLSENDFVRVSRALEVFELTGKPMSVWQASHGFKVQERPARLFGVRREPGELDARIEARCRLMFENGFIEEARNLLERGYGDCRPFGSVGYKQLRAALSSGRDLDVASLIGDVYRATRVFARRQRTWLRDQPVNWLEAGSTKLR
jgi:tRNA dimethylallyltransferase